MTSPQMPFCTPLLDPERLQRICNQPPEKREWEKQSLIPEDPNQKDPQKFIHGDGKLNNF